MPPSIPPLAPSEPKSRFVQRLGLDHPGRQHLYAIMKEEASSAWARLQSSRDGLLHNFKDCPSIQPPYSNSQISETALHREIISIYENASPQTRPFYDLAHDTQALAAENWIVRWLLWHVFRDRDRRKNNHARDDRPGAPTSKDATIAQNKRSTEFAAVQVFSSRLASGGVVMTPDPSPAPRVELPYDPVRDC